MGFLDLIGIKRAKEGNNTLPNNASLDTVVRQLWRRDFASAAQVERTLQQGSNSNDIVAITANYFAKLFQEPPLKLYKPNGEVADEKDRLYNALRFPNKAQSEARFKLQSALQMIAGGATAWHKQRNGAGELIGFRAYPVSQLAAVTTKDELIAGYVYNLGEGKYKPVDVEDVILIHWLNADPANPIKPISPLRSVIKQALLDNEATALQGATLANKGIPSSTLSYPEDYDLTEEQQEKLKREFEKGFTGQNRGRVKILTGGAKLERLAYDFKELELSALRNIPETRIPLALGIDPLALGLNVALANSTYANKEEAKRGTVQSTLVPIWRYVADAITNGIQDEKGYEGYYVEFDLTQVEALQPPPEERHKRARDLWNDDLITRGAALEMIGMEKPEVDGYKTELTKLPAAPLSKSVGGVEEQGKFKAAFATGKAWQPDVKAAYFKRYDNLLEEWAEGYANTLAKTFTTLFNQLKTRIALETKALDSIDVEQWTKEFKRATKKQREELLDRLVLEAGEDVEARADELETAYERTRRAGVNESSDKISKALYTFRDEMRELLAANPDSTAAELEELLSKRFFDTIDYRVRRIARTTATASTGVAQRETWQTLNEERSPNKQINRVWLSMRDSDVREKPSDSFDHKKVDDQIENAEGYFNVDGERAKYPSSSELSAGNAVNCRCITYPRLGNPTELRNS